MSNYTPDNWVIIKIKETKLSKPFYKVLAGWSGGYLDGDSWRMNSGILEVKDDGDFYEIVGFSGSVYYCHKKAYGLRMNNAGVWNHLKENEGFEGQLELMEDQNWLEFNF